MRDLLLDVNIVVDVCSARRPWHVDSAEAIARCLDHGGRVWLYSGSVQTYEYSLAKEIFRVNQEKGVSFANSLAAARDVLAVFCNDKNWLAALAGEGDVFAASDPEGEQLIRALDRFSSGSIKLLTRDKLLLKEHPENTISPEHFCSITSKNRQIPFVDLSAQQDCIRPALEKNIHTVLHHGRYIMGPEIQELEQELTAFTDSKHCIACSSGTDALQLALMALDIGPGDEIITTPFTFIATGEMIAHLGATPVFVDIDEATYNINASFIDKAITDKTRAIMPVSLYGQPADMDEIKAIVDKHNLQPETKSQKPITIIEDAAQSFGATYKGRQSCNLSEIGCTSFFPAKPLGCYGDGGALFTSDDHLAEKIRYMRIHGQNKRYRHKYLGIGARMDTIQAATLLTKLGRYPDEIQKRQHVASVYTKHLRGHVITPAVKDDRTSAWAQYSIRVKDRDRVQTSLKDAGIPTAVHYPMPLHLQECFQYLGYKQGDFPVAEKVSEEIMSLPMHPYLSGEEIQRVASELREKS